MQTDKVEQVAPGVRRILAPNPSPMTGTGTNSYIIGEGRDLVLIDPGPAIPSHISLILQLTAPHQNYVAIVVTHGHIDHTEAVPELAAATGAPVLAFGAPGSARSPVMQRLSQSGLTSGGEGVDKNFRPDRTVAHEEKLHGDFGTLEFLHSPGHMAEHICIVYGNILFSGDHAMGWSTSLVSPPDGDMSAYMSSLTSLKSQDWDLMLPGHGLPVRHVQKRLEELWLHRKMRERQILTALEVSSADCFTLAKRLYTDTPAGLLPAAARNILAHLIDLTERNEISAQGLINENTVFSAHNSFP